MFRHIRTLAAVAALSLAATVQLQAQARTAPIFQPSAAPLVVQATLIAPREATPAQPLAPAESKSAFARSGFAQFMASPAGRVFRGVAGVAMVAGGIAMDSNGGNVLAVAGAVPLSAALFDVCWLSPIFGGPFKGADIRAAKK